MISQECYLRPNVMAEPLVDDRYAWAHLIPPATLARNVTERHLRIMDSYIEAPETHRAAVKDPQLLGGPFMDFPQNRVEDVKRLRDRTVRERKRLGGLSRAIEQLDTLLREKATGYSLESLYSEVPELLQGYVELVYDLNNCASFRLIEPLLYKSPYYDCRLQSVVLSEISGDDRPFVLSTPRLDDAGQTSLNETSPTSLNKTSSTSLNKTSLGSPSGTCSARLELPFGSPKYHRAILSDRAFQSLDRDLSFPWHHC